MATLFLTLVWILCPVGAAKPVNVNVASKVSDGISNDVDPSWYCDDKQYCDGGTTCCPVLGNPSTFTCAPAGQRFNTCSMDGSVSCAEDYPIMCGSGCCKPEDVCRDGQCYVRSSTDSLNVTVPGAGSVDAKRPVARAAAGPLVGQLGWFPNNWDDGMLNTVMTLLHEDFLAVQASEWRSTENKPGNCWVVGFPSDLSKCPTDQPWNDACKGSSATITQDGPYTFYNNNPVFAPTNYDHLDWCNDAHNATQSYSHEYSVTETQSYSTTLSSTIKATVGMSSETEAKVDIGVASGSEKFTLSASLETDFSSSSTQTKTTEKAWKASTQIQVKPRTHVYSSCWLQTGTFNSPFDGRVKINSPVTWACSSPLKDPNYWIYPTDSNYWTSQGIEQVMEGKGFSKEDLQNVFGQKIGGTFTGIAGQKVQCSTHIEYLKDGESCPRVSPPKPILV